MTVALSSYASGNEKNQRYGRPGGSHDGLPVCGEGRRCAVSTPEVGSDISNTDRTTVLSKSPVVGALRPV